MFPKLWAIASRPAKAGRLRKSTVERLLKQHRIRRMDAETVLRILREPAIKVAEGVAEAASIHMRSLVARLRIVNRELREAERKLDERCTAISEIEQTSGEGLDSNRSFPPCERVAVFRPDQEGRNRKKRRSRKRRLLRRLRVRIQFPPAESPRLPEFRPPMAESRLFARRRMIAIPRPVGSARRANGRNRHRAAAVPFRKGRRAGH